MLKQMKRRYVELSPPLEHLVSMHISRRGRSTGLTRQVDQPGFRLKPDRCRGCHREIVVAVVLVLEDDAEGIADIDLGRIVLARARR